MHYYTIAVQYCVNVSVEPDGESMETKPSLPSFAPSKWETVDESELESQGEQHFCFT